MIDFELSVTSGLFQRRLAAAIKDKNNERGRVAPAADDVTKRYSSQKESLLDIKILAQSNIEGFLC